MVRWWQSLKPEEPIEPTPEIDYKHLPFQETLDYFDAIPVKDEWWQKKIHSVAEQMFVSKRNLTEFGEAERSLTTLEFPSWMQGGSVIKDNPESPYYKYKDIIGNLRYGLDQARQEREAPSYSGISFHKDEYEKMIAEGRIAEVPQGYYDYLAVTDRSRYEEIRQEREFQKEHTAEEYQVDIKQRQEKAAVVGEKTAEAEKQIEDYWNWIKGGKQGVEPAKDLLAPSIPATRDEAGTAIPGRVGTIEQLEDFYKTQGPEYTGAEFGEMAGKLGKAAATYKAQQAEAKRDWDKQSELFGKKITDYQEYANKGGTLSYVDFFKETFPDDFSKLLPQFIEQVPDIYKLTPEEIQKTQPGKTQLELKREIETAQMKPREVTMGPITPQELALTKPIPTEKKSWWRRVYDELPISPYYWKSEEQRRDIEYRQTLIDWAKGQNITNPEEYVDKLLTTKTGEVTMGPVTEGKTLPVRPPVVVSKDIFQPPTDRPNIGERFVMEWVAPFMIPIPAIPSAIAGRAALAAKGTVTAKVAEKLLYPAARAELGIKGAEQIIGKVTGKIAEKSAAAAAQRFEKAQIKELETFAKLMNFSDTEKMLFKETAMRNMAEAVEKKLPGSRRFIKVLNPTYGVTGDVLQGYTTRAYMQVMVEGRLNIELAQFAKYDVKKMLGIVGDSSMTKWGVAEGDLIQHMEKYAVEKGIPNEIRDICIGLRDTVAKWERFFEACGGKMKGKIVVPEGGFFPRFALTKDGVEITTRYGTTNLSGKSSLFNSRWYQEMADGIAAAKPIGYMNDPVAITQIYCRAAANSGLDKLTAKHLTETLGLKTARESLDKIIIEGLDTARRFKNDQQFLLIVTNRAARGESLSGMTRSAINRISPDIAKKVDELMLLTPKSFEQALVRSINELKMLNITSKKFKETVEVLRGFKIDKMHPVRASEIDATLRFLNADKKIGERMLRQIYRGTDIFKREEFIALKNTIKDNLLDAQTKYFSASKAYQRGIAGIKADASKLELTGIFQGRYASPEVAQEITKYFGQTPGAYKYVRGFNDYFNRILRFAQTGFDFGVGHLQLLPMLIVRPDLWVKTQFRSLEFMFNPRAQAEFMSRPENMKIFLEMTQDAGMALGMRAAEMVELGALGKITRFKPIGVPAKAFQRQFSAAIDMAKFYTFKGLRGLAKNPEDMRGLGSFIDNLFGTLNSSKLGIMPLRQELETMLLYAPRYLRAYLALATHMFQGGLEGKLARESFAAVLTGMTAEYYALNKAFKAIGWTDKDAVLDPRNSQVFTIWFNDNAPPGLRGRHIGLGSNWVSLFLRIPANIYKQASEDPRGLINLRNWKDNQILRALRSKSSIFMGTAINVLTGRTYIGESLDLPENVMKEFLDTITPFWLDFTAEENSLLPKITFYPTELLGMRCWAVQQYELDRQDLDKATAKFCKENGISVMTWKEAQENNNWIVTKVKEANPDLAKRLNQSWHDYARNNPDEPSVQARQALDTAENLYHISLEQNNTDLMNGDITIKKWREENSKAGAAYGTRMEDIQNNPDFKKVFANWDEQRKIPELTFNEAYYDYIARVVSPEFTVQKTEGDRVKGDFDFEARQAAIDLFINGDAEHKGWGEDYYKKIIEIKQLNLPETNKSVGELIDGLKPYWDIPYKQTHTRNTWLKENLFGDAALVVLGYKDMPKNKEADTLVDNIMLLLGLTPEGIYGKGTTQEIFDQFREYSRLEGKETLSIADEKKLYREIHGPFNKWLEEKNKAPLLNPAEQLVLQYDFSVSRDEALRKLNSYFKTPSDEIGKIHQEEMRRIDFVLDASLCITGEETRPLTDAGWDALSKLLPLNNKTWDDLYGVGAKDVIDYIKVYYSLKDITEQKAYRYTYQQLDAWGVRNPNPGWTPITERNLKEKNNYTAIAKTKGWK